MEGKVSIALYMAAIFERILASPYTAFLRVPGALSMKGNSVGYGRSMLIRRTLAIANITEGIKKKKPSRKTRRLFCVPERGALVTNNGA